MYNIRIYTRTLDRILTTVVLTSLYKEGFGSLQL